MEKNILKTEITLKKLLIKTKTNFCYYIKQVLLVMKDSNVLMKN